MRDVHQPLFIEVFFEIPLLKYFFEIPFLITKSCDTMR